MPHKITTLSVERPGPDRSVPRCRFPRVEARCLSPEAAARFSEVRQEHRTILAQIEARFARNVRQLRRQGARPEAIYEVEEEKRRQIDQENARFREKVRQLLNEFVQQG